MQNWGGPVTVRYRSRLGLHRRAILQGALAATAFLARAHAADAPLAATDLPGGLTLISGAGGNVVCARGKDGAVMVDSGTAAHAAELAALVKKRTGQAKVATLFNTCWRLEQTGGNDAFGAAGARIVSHEITRQWMGTEIVSRWEGRTYPPRAPAARPIKTFYATETFGAAADRIDCGYLLQAHTDGDIYVFLRKANVLCAGGAVSGRGWPMIDWSTNGWIGGHVRGLETLIAIADDKTVIVPADGPVLTKADLRKQHEMFVGIMNRMQTLIESGQGTPDLLKARLCADWEAERGDPTQFLTQSYKSFWGHIRQFKAI
jgi:glyoxylase-like metal-dependent hydrolase (beta-lactamase superfamily II)